MGIEWVQVRGYEGLYEISEYGEVRTLKDRGRYKKGTLMIPKITYKGYLFMRLTNSEGKRSGTGVHRLVLSSFGEMKSELQVNHKDGVKTNNHLSNLEWVTAKENIEHKVMMGLQAKGEQLSFSKLNDDIVNFIRENYKAGCRIFGSRALGRKYGVDHMTILSCVRGETWKHI